MFEQSAALNVICANAASPVHGRHQIHRYDYPRWRLFALIGIVVLCAILLMQAEGWSFGDSLYTAAITALTIGYGDITPKTVPGRIISVAIGFFGILYTGLIVAVAARALAAAVNDEAKAQARHRQRKKASGNIEGG